MTTTNTPTAEEFLKSIFPDTKYSDQDYEVLREFAKLHVEAALKEASSQAYWDGADGVNIKSILNSYPLTNIK